MPKYNELGDKTPYKLQQTDFIIQLGAQDDYINRWAFHNQTGIARSEEKNKTGAYHKNFTKSSSINAAATDIYTAIKIGPQ